MTGIAAPGSTLWLLGCELRLTARQWFSRGARVVSFVIVVLALGAGCAFGGVPLALWLRHAPLVLAPPLVLALDLGLLVVFTLILSQTLSAAVLAFFERGDLDLLLSSPLPPGRVLTVRAVSIALTPFLWFALFLTPVLLPLALLQSASWALDYLLLAAVALLASSAGVFIAMGLIRTIGPRATRTLGQLLAAVIGALFFLASQARNLLPDRGRSLGASFLRLGPDGPLSPQGLLAIPARAALGEPLPVLALAGGGFAIFTILTLQLGRRFADDAARAAGSGRARRRALAPAVSDRSFGGGPFLALMRKELRLLRRDPVLLSQVLLRTIYVVPLTALVVRDAGGGGGKILLAAGAGAIVFMAGQIAGSLAWITISAEDAPELLACAPVPASLARRAKLVATLIPVAVLMAVPIGTLMILRPWVGFCAAVGAALSAGSSGLINLWYEKPAPRTAFRSRRGGSVTGASAELLLGLGWAATTGLAGSFSAYALAPGVLSILALGLLRVFARPDRRY